MKKLLFSSLQAFFSILVFSSILIFPNISSASSLSNQPISTNINVTREANLASILSSIQSIIDSIRKEISLLQIASRSQLASLEGADSGLVGWWKFDEGSGTLATDSSGNGNSGTLINGLTWTTGKVGSGALNFDGVDDYLSLSNGSAFNNNTFSISFWINPNTTFSGTIFRLSNSSSNSAYRSKYEIRAANSSVIFITGDGSANYDLDTFSASISGGSWSYVACSLDSGGVKSCYLNGQLISSLTNDVNISLNTGAAALLGTNRGAAGNNFYEGSMDDVRVYNRALSASDVSELYALGGPANGTCGIAAKTYTVSETFPSGSYCSPGIVNPAAPSNPAQGGSSSWECIGSNGGTTVSCAATRLAPPDTTPPAISNIQVSGITSSGATISWTTNEPADSQIQYGLTSSYGSETTLDPSLATTHSQTITGLQANTTYNYRVLSKDTAGNLTQSTNQTFITALPEGGQCSSISQFGITWYFDKEYACGTFASGDYWVKGPITITRITPDFDGTNNGWEVNPKVVSKQGFQANGAHYDASLMPVLPYTATTNQSIVKVIGGATGNASVVKMAAVLTVLMEAPLDNGAGMFRPPYIGDAKPLYKVSDLRTDLLPSYAAVGMPPTLVTIASNFSKGLRMDHHASVPRWYRPSDVMGDYQPENTKTVNEAILRLMLNDPIQDKMQALIKVTQPALDRAYAVLNGYRRLDDGHNPNHRVLAGFAAALLDIQAVKDVLMNESTIMHEDYFVLKPGTIALWGDPTGSYSYNENSYWGYIRTGSGSKSHKDPYGYIDGGKLGPSGASYQNIVAQSQKGEALITRLMPALSVAWRPSQWPIFSEYADRWVSHGVWALPDPCAPADGLCVGGTNSGAKCTTATGSTVCGTGGTCDLNAFELSHYGVTYGPNGSGGCILDTDSSDGTGRFPQYHGANKDGGQYKSAFVAAMWDAYRGFTSTSTPSTPTCTSFTYSSWSTCSGGTHGLSLSGTQTRTILTSSPSGCTGGSPITSQTCTPETNNQQQTLQSGSGQATPPSTFSNPSPTPGGGSPTINFNESSTNSPSISSLTGSFIPTVAQSSPTPSNSPSGRGSGNTTATSSRSSLVSSGYTLVPLSSLLNPGSRKPDVKNLQDFLIYEGLLSSDSNTGFYGKLTQAGVEKFQLKYNVTAIGKPWTTGYGVVGNKTKTAMNKRIGEINLLNGSTSLTTGGGEERLKLIEAIKKQILELQLQLLQMMVKEKGI